MMTTSSIVSLFYSAQFIALTLGAAGKIWSPGNTDNWQPNGANKCSASRAVLTKQLDGIFYMDFQKQQQKSLNELILPQDGAVVVPDTFHLELTNEQKCTDDNFTLLKQVFPRSWFDPDNWITNTMQDPNAKSNANKAKPHIDRIPCECDTVLIPSISSVSIDLELVDEIVVDRININNHLGDFTRFLETEIGQRMFANSEAVRFERGACNPPKHRSCRGYRLFIEYLSIVCKIEKPKCPIPLCLAPIEPMGHCCPICGAMMVFRIREDADDFRVNEIDQLIQTKLRRFRNGRYKNTLEYYVGFMPDDRKDDRFVQLIVVEKDDYAAISVDFMNFIRKDAKFQGDNNVPIFTLLSGIPYQPNGGWAWSIVFGSLFFVVLLYTIFYAYYEKQLDPFSSVVIRRFQPFRNSVVFARFGNRQTDDSEGNDDVTVEFNEPTNAAAQRAIMGFNNPLFKSDNQREQPETEPQDNTVAAVTVNENDCSENGDVESIKLVDIELDSSSSNAN